MTDKQLTMDKKWLEDLLKQHHEEAYRWACQCCHQDEEMAKDVLQIVYVKILDEKARFNEKSSFRTWLFSVIRFTAIDELKKSSKESFVDLDAIKEESVMQPTRSIQGFERHLAQLSEKQRQVILLVFYHGLTIESAADVMDCGLGSARTHYSRAKEKLKQLIEQANV